jgi:hypothetical protein
MLLTLFVLLVCVFYQRYQAEVMPWKDLKGYTSAGSAHINIQSLQRVLNNVRTLKKFVLLRHLFCVITSGQLIFSISIGKVDHQRNGQITRTS